MVEIHGQHDDRGLIAPAGHRALLDAFARTDTSAVAAAHGAWKGAEARLRLATTRAALAEAERDRDWLAHCVAELTALAPQPGEEAALAAERAAMQQGEKIADDLHAVMAAFAGQRQRPGATARRRAAARPARGRASACSPKRSPRSTAL